MSNISSCHVTFLYFLSFWSFVFFSWYVKFIYILNTGLNFRKLQRYSYIPVITFSLRRLTLAYGGQLLQGLITLVHSQFQLLQSSSSAFVSLWRLIYLDGLFRVWTLGLPLKSLISPCSQAPFYFFPFNPHCFPSPVRPACQCLTWCFLLELLPLGFCAYYLFNYLAS